MRTKRLACVILWAVFLSVACNGCAMLKRAALTYAGQPIQDKTKIPQHPIPTRNVR